ncbi:hypothetical protein, partial [Klebsiella pneumoniae]|uniref:hypothetical protein n=1 Tax=Klebsiella pneumoniae TaxID=573 RepID=UPI00387EC5A7
EAVKIVGVGKVYVVDDVVFGHALVENVVSLIVELMGYYDVFVVLVISNGKNIVLCVAVLLDVM